MRPLTSNAVPLFKRLTESRAGRVLLVTALVLMTAGFQFRQRYGYMGWMPSPYREGLPTKGDVIDRGFTFCRLLYTSVRREDKGHGWNTDYPLSDENFMTRFEQLTTVQISRWDDGLPGHAVARVMDDMLFECPFLFASDAGVMGLSTEEADQLREYFMKGGFLWVDDFWGNAAWDHWVREIEYVLPEYEIVDLPMDHPLLHALYRVPEIPQVPSIQFWNESGRRRTSERGRESETPHLRVIFDEKERPIVIMTHNTDIADGWEREGQDEEFFYTFSAESYAVGFNVLLWTMTH